MEALNTAAKMREAQLKYDVGRFTSDRLDLLRNKKMAEEAFDAVMIDLFGKKVGGQGERNTLAKLLNQGVL
jgi:hypothetical protein